MSTKTKSRVWLILRIVFFGGACILLIRSLNLSKLLQHLRSIPPFCLVLAFGLQLLMRLLMAWQLQWALGAYRVSLPLKTLFSINLVMAFYGLVLPGELTTGGVGWYRLRKAGCDGSTALAAMVFTRLINLSILFVIGMLFWAISGQTQDYQTGAFLFLVLVMISIGYLVVAKNSQKLSSLPLPEKLRGPWQRFVELLTELQSFSRSHIVALVSLAVGLNLLGVASHLVFAHAVGLSLSVWTIGWIRSAVLAFGLLPFSLGGFGLREGSLIFLLHMHGATTEQAVTYSLLTVLMTLGVGALGATSEVADLRQQHSRIRDDDP